MPKEVSYNRASLKKALELTETVYSLGKSCKLATCAETMKMKSAGGGFREIVGTAAKYGFIKHSKGELIITDEFLKDYKNAYSEEEKREFLQKSFFLIPIFKALYLRFKNNEILPDTNTLPKILIREYEINSTVAKRVSSHFINDAKAVGLYNVETKCLNDSKFSEEKLESSAEYTENNIKTEESSVNQEKPIINNEIFAENYTVSFSGPGIKSAVVIECEDDFIIVESIIKKIKNKLAEK